MVDEAELVLEQELLKLQMDDSREALTQKLEQLEEKVTSTVENATATVAEATANVMETVQTATATVSETVGNVSDAVQGTVDSVRQTVEGTVGSVKDAFDVERQVQAHPWVMVGGAAVLGYVACRMLIPSVPRRQSARGFGAGLSLPADSRGFAASENSGYPLHGATRSAAPLNRATQYATNMNSSNGSVAKGISTPAESLDSSLHTTQSAIQQPESPSWWTKTLGPELNRLQGLAIGTALGLAREVIVEAAPEPIQKSLGDIIDGFTTKLGGQRIEGSLLSSMTGPSEHPSDNDDQVNQPPPYKIPR